MQHQQKEKNCRSSSTTSIEEHAPVRKALITEETEDVAYALLSRRYVTGLSCYSSWRCLMYLLRTSMDVVELLKTTW